jgi:DNA-binding FrmR family transcriptional regulator
MALTRNKLSLTQKDKTTVQLKRIRGQVDGLIRMYENERPCVEIAQQITAARNSLSRVARDVLSNAADHCIRSKDQKQLNLILKELLK